MPELIWTLGSCKEEAAKYTTRTQFSNAAGGAYNKAPIKGYSLCQKFWRHQR